MTVHFFCDDAADQIARFIDEVENTERNAERQRDVHRATSMKMAYHQALETVLLEHACKEDGKSHPMPDAEEYMRQWHARQAEPA